MKIKDLKKNVSLNTQIVKTPDGRIGYWKSQWNKGVWLNNGKDSKIIPVFVESLEEALDWEIINDPNEINI